jgi:beta-glucanase (GH16 family)
MRIVFAAALAASLTLSAQEPGVLETLRVGSLNALPPRTSQQHPLSDQPNRGGWVRYEPMWDEFDGVALDAARWHPNNPKWLGRQPAFFWTQNVTVSGGSLNLAMRRQEAPGMPRDSGYKDYTSAAVKSKGTVLYGYFEVRARPMNSAGSSSFWFYDDQPDIWTEIDVFEIGGKAKGFERKYNMNLHVFRTPAGSRHWSRGAIWQAPFRFADDYHVFGFEWDVSALRWYVDGVLVRSSPNTHWHQPLTMNFDSETMPDWFGMPAGEDLPSTYSIDYVRSWKHPGSQPE